VKPVHSAHLALLVAVVLAAGVRAGEAAPQSPAFTFEDRTSRTSVTFPGGYWKPLTRAEQQRSGGGCSSGGEAPAAFAWAGQHLDLAGASIQCWRVPRSFHVREAADLEALKAGVLQEILGKGLSVEVESHEETVRGDMMVHRAVVKLTRDERTQRLDVTHFFLRQADGDKGVLWYQFWCGAPDDADADISVEFDAILDSFRYTGATLPIAEFYEPEPSDEQILTPEQAAKSFASPRSTPWLPIIAMVGVVVFFMRPRRRTEAVAR